MMTSHGEGNNQAILMSVLKEEGVSSRGFSSSEMGAKFAEPHRNIASNC